MVKIRQISNFWGRHGKKHTAPVVWPQSGVKDNFHGQIIQDGFSWLQDNKCHKVMKIVKNENRFTNKVMSDTALFQKDLVGKFEDIADRIGSYLENNLPVSFGNFLYYSRRSKDDPNFLVHCRRRQNGSGHEEILLDETKTVGYWQHFDVRTMKISPTQKFVAFIVDTSGSDTYSGILVDTLKNPGQIVEQLPCVNIEWSGVDKVLYYTTFDDLHRANKVWRHEIGHDRLKDELIFEEKDARFFVDVSCTKDGHFVTINSSSKTTSEVYILDSADTKASAQLVRAREAGIEYYVEHCDDLFYVLTNYPDGGNYRVMVVSERELCQKKWKSVAYDKNEVILDDMDIFSKYLILYERKDLIPRITVLSLPGSKKEYTIEFDDSITMLRPGCNVVSNASLFLICCKIVYVLYLSALLCECVNFS